MTGEDPRAALSRTPAPIGRRLLSMAYEGVLLFGITFAAGMVYAISTQQRHGLQGRSGLIAVLFLTLGVYFIGFWVHSGQTLAMRTWHIRLLRKDGRPVGPQRALARYLASWLWFLAPAAVDSMLGLTHQAAALALTVVLWFAGYVALAARHPRRQFLHDALCGTELVDTRPQPEGAASR